MRAMIRIVLDAADFRDLVAGREVQARTLGAETVMLILADIGWARMLIAIDDAMRERMHDALDPPEGFT
jgi:hypothetical protein